MAIYDPQEIEDAHAEAFPGVAADHRQALCVALSHIKQHEILIEEKQREIKRLTLDIPGHETMLKKLREQAWKHAYELSGTRIPLDATEDMRDKMLSLMGVLVGPDAS